MTMSCSPTHPVGIPLVGDASVRNTKRRSGLRVVNDNDG